jgi:two-component system, NtrC family, nitrogen regulation sensor histidine kinase NtrY
MDRKDIPRKLYFLTGASLFFILVFLISVIFLNPSSVGNENFVGYFSLWALFWSLIFLTILILAFILARNIIKIFFEYQSHTPGSGLKTKLVLTFGIFSLFPSMIMLFIAYGLINQNLTKWVSAPSEQLLESSQVIADEFYSLKEKQILAAGQSFAEDLGESGYSNQDRVLEMLDLHGFKGGVLLSPSGKRIALFGSCSVTNDMAVQIPSVLRGEKYYSLQHKVNKRPGIVDIGVVGIPIGEYMEESSAVLFLDFTVSESVLYHAGKVYEANEAYKDLKGTLASLRINYFSILALTTLAVVFSLIWLGTYIAKKLTVPLEALVEGSRALAGGNLDYRVNVRAIDELKVLVDTFNRMASELKQNRRQLESANEELREANRVLDENHHYIETVLQNIATGVVTVDQDEVICTANEAVFKMFQFSGEDIRGLNIKDALSSRLYTEFQEMKKRADLYGISRRQVSFSRQGYTLFVAATVSANPVSQGNRMEYLIVLDDLTELIRSEKFSAWQEVARRLAHEIKNPLTPIQLSAERVKKRFLQIASGLPASSGADEFGEILTESCRIIVEESRKLKSLLDEFSQFSRMPLSKPEFEYLHQLIDKSLALYEGRTNTVRIKKVYDEAISKVCLDAGQFQRVIVNLMDNSLDALADEDSEFGEICVVTQLNNERGTVRLEFQDTGPGISNEDYDLLFLPYFSTKKKGTGLGLAIVRQIISEHNGFIRAEPNQPKGTRVIIEIPVNCSG